MKNLNVAAIAAALALLVTPSLSIAQQVKQFQLVGFSNGTLRGDAGVFRMATRCQADYEASRMCTSEEVMDTVIVPSLPNGTTAWVRPSIKPVASGDLTISMDASGADSTLNNGSDTADLTCMGWNQRDNVRGLTVNDSGGFSTQPCDFQRRIACCSLITVPEPSIAALHGSAVAALASLAVAKRVRS
jgi:hypothetical protein